MSVTPPEKYMELVFLYYKNSIGPGALQSAQKQWWFSAKNKDGHCVFACCGGSGLAQWAKHVLLVFYICTWENGRPLQITFYYLRICQTNCLTCATCNLLNMEGSSLISLIWTKLKNILGFDVSAILVSIYSDESTLVFVCFGWFWCCSVFFLLVLVKILMHFLCTFYALFKRA